MVRVKRIVPNLHATEAERAAGDTFYRDILGLECLMDLGWIQTYGGPTPVIPQVNLGTEGGSETLLPQVSIEVDSVDEAYTRMSEAGFEITYGPKDEPWGVRRFYVLDPYGNLLNILEHHAAEQ